MHSTFTAPMDPSFSLVGVHAPIAPLYSSAQFAVFTLPEQSSATVQPNVGSLYLHTSTLLRATRARRESIFKKQSV